MQEKGKKKIIDNAGALQKKYAWKSEKTPDTKKAPQDKKKKSNNAKKTPGKEAVSESQKSKKKPAAACPYAKKCGGRSCGGKADPSAQSASVYPGHQASAPVAGPHPAVPRRQCDGSFPAGLPARPANCRAPGNAGAVLSELELKKPQKRIKIKETF